jgi:bifunctional DNase/RNase
MIPMDVLTVGKLQGSDEYFVILQEHDGDRLVPIHIGPFEAIAISRGIAGGPQPRPFTHDLMASVIGRLGGTLERVLVHDLRDDTFFSQLELETSRGLLEVDCRTSDAIALAVRVHSPIYATEEVVNRAAVLPRPQEQDPNDEHS